MAARKRLRPEVRDLLDQARHDFETARMNFTHGAHEVAAFLCQQSVEKGLKALFIHRRSKRPETTHDLTKLGDAVSAPAVLSTALGELTADYVTSRYPDAANGVPYKVYTKERGASKIRAAEEAWEWLDRQF